MLHAENHLCMGSAGEYGEVANHSVADLGGGGGGGGGGHPPLLLHHFIFLLTNLLPLRCNSYSWPGLLSSQYRALPETERLGNETTI